MADKIKLDVLLHAYRCTEYWLDLFSLTVNDRSKLYGLEWHSTNRRYKLAKDQYERLYYGASSVVRARFHVICSDYSRVWYDWFHRQTESTKRKYSGRCHVPPPHLPWKFVEPE